MLPTMNRRGTRASRRVTVLTAALLGAAVGAGTIAGCANDEPEPQAQEKPDKEQEPAPDPEPTQEETSDESELPEHLDGEHTRAVLAFYAEYNKAIKSGETEAFRNLATDDCYSCQSMAEKIDDVFSDGGRYEGRLVPVLDSEGNRASNSGETAAVKLLYERKGMAIYPGDGGEPVVPETKFTDEQINLVREGDQWLVDEITSEGMKGE